LTYWHSRKDAGQADAIATGFEMATGEIYCWLNSDDILLPGALQFVGDFFRRHPRADFLYGNRIVIDREGREIGRHVWPWHLTRAHWAVGQPLAQECCFWRRALYEKVGGIDRSRFFVMDYDLFFRMWCAGRFRKTSRFLGALRQHQETKNARHADIWRRELEEAKARFGLREPGYLGLRLLNHWDRLQRLAETLLLGSSA
jgi:GT2 family glycosyltransferase